MDILSFRFRLRFASYLCIVFFGCTAVEATSECLIGLNSKTYLDTAIDMLEKANSFYQSDLVTLSKPEDCDDLLRLGYNTSGVHTIWPRNRVMEGKSLNVFCDMDTDGGGWTLIQRRGNFSRAVDFFFKNWDSYKKGFGHLETDFWLGNDNIFAISNQKQYSARFDLRDIEGNVRYALYDSFWIDDENHKYMLHIRDYSGNAGDSMYPKHNKQMFSTKDQKNDNRDHAEGCAETFKGAWWYNACHDSNLNGLYLKGKHESHANGVNWKSWKGHKESLEGTEIKLRPIKSERNKLLTPQR